MTILPGEPDNDTYVFFPGSTTLEAAVKRYTERFCAAPPIWFSYNGQIWLGPVPDRQSDTDLSDDLHESGKP
jgi:hypothetical protein